MAFLYTEEHLYLEIKENSPHTAIIGITNYALEILGEIVFLDLPKVNKDYILGESFITLESSKAATDLCAPISGKIISNNTQLLENISLINVNPQDKGWLCVISIEKPEELDSFMNEEQYLQFTQNS